MIFVAILIIIFLGLSCVSEKLSPGLTGFLDQFDDFLVANKCLINIQFIAINVAKTSLNLGGKS